MRGDPPSFVMTITPSAYPALMVSLSLNPILSLILTPILSLSSLA